MDPEANLREQHELAQEIIEITDEAGDAGLTVAEMCDVAELSERLAELVQAYCEWVQNGGFVPSGLCGE